MKRKLFISAIISLSLLFVFCITGCTKNNEKSYTTGLEYELNDNDTYTVTGIGTATDKEIIIPEVINNKPVVSISDHAFEKCNFFAKVIIPDSIKTIGDYAFYNCMGLAHVTIGSGVEKIEENTFKNSYNLLEVFNFSSLELTYEELKTTSDIQNDTSPNNYHPVISTENRKSEIEIIDNFVFAKGGYLVGYVGSDTIIVLPKSFHGQTYEISNYAFLGREDIVEVYVTNGVKYINPMSFYGCTSIKSMQFQSGNWKVLTCSNMSGEFQQQFEKSLPSILYGSNGHNILSNLLYMMIQYSLNI